MSFIKGAKSTTEIDFYKLLPDNLTIGTQDYFKNKYGDKFSDTVYKYMEIKARKEYNENDEEDYIQQINDSSKSYEEKLLSEFMLREQEGEEPVIESESENYRIAK